jgi:hypothetical protein
MRKYFSFIGYQPPDNRALKNRVQTSSNTLARRVRSQEFGQTTLDTQMDF